MTALLGPSLRYPLSCAAAVAAFALLLHAGAPLPLAVYTPVLLLLATVTTFERFDPERIDWRPRAADVRADIGFMALVQGLLPRALAALLVLLVASSSHAIAERAPWPHYWSIAAQMILMVLVVDLLRYGLHRACHRFTALWRLHEVHHSPEILYALNTGRFHPFEKALHFALDTAWAESRSTGTIMDHGG